LFSQKVYIHQAKDHREVQGHIVEGDVRLETQIDMIKSFALTFCRAKVSQLMFLKKGWAFTCTIPST
jgi:riboflavin synthase alpha subunit